MAPTIKGFYLYSRKRWPQMSKHQLRHSLLLFLAASIWGVAFVAQSTGMKYVSPFTFSCIRSLLGALFLIPFIFLMGRKNGANKSDSKGRKTLLIGGIACGFVLFIAMNLQMFGLQYTSVGKAGFITACYIVWVPIFSMLFKKKAGRQIWIAVLLAVFGLYLLCMTENLTIGAGDVLILLCSFMFTFHILVIDHFSPKVDGVKLSCIQFFVCGILSGIPMFLFDHPQTSHILAAWVPIAYAGFLSCGVAYTLQIIGQKGLNPTVASLVMSLESCISVLAGWLILKQHLTLREIAGCLFMFGAIVLSQVPQKSASKNVLQNNQNHEPI